MTPSVTEQLVESVRATVTAERLDPRANRQRITELAGDAVERYRRESAMGAGVPLTNAERVVERIVSSVCGHGAIESLFTAGGVEDIFIEGDRVTYFQDGRLRGLVEPTSEAENLHVVTQLLASTDASLDRAHPTADGVQVLDGRARLTAAIPPASPHLSADIRLYVNRFATLPQLVESDTLNAPAADLLTLDVWAKGSMLICGETGSGKSTLLAAVLAVARENHCQPVDEPVLTPDGWVPIETLRPGDAVIGSNGKPTSVLATERVGSQPVFRLTFSDGSWTRTTGDHLWCAQTKLRKQREGSWQTVTTEAMGGTLGRDWRVPIVEPVHHTPLPLPIEPYLLGVLLGDGSLGTGADNFGLTTEAEIVDSLGLDTRVYRRWPGDVVQVGIHDGALRSALRSLALWGKRSWEKHVPSIYLLGHPEDRLALLQGLLDADGCATVVGNAEFTSTAPGLVDAVVALVRSLGGVVVSRRLFLSKYRPIERLRVRLPAHLTPFRLRRKVDAYIAPTRYQPLRLLRSVEPDGTTECMGILVSAGDGLYVTRDHLVTHNCVRLCEESIELQFRPTHGGRYQGIAPGPDGRGGRSLRDLIKLMLRMRPDIIAVGEVRAEESWELARASRVGAGFLATIHANSAEDGLEALVLTALGAGPNITEDLVRRAFARSIDLVVHMERDDPNLVAQDASYLHQVTEIRAVVPQIGKEFSSELIFERKDGLGSPLTWTGKLPPTTLVQRLERLLPKGTTLRDVLLGRAGLR